MKSIFKKSILVFLCLAMVLSLTACSGDAIVKPLAFDPQHTNVHADSFVAAENDTYQLKWDAENLRIVLYDKILDKIYTSTPADALNPRFDETGSKINNHPKIESPILIECVETELFSIKNANGLVQSLRKGTYSIEKVDNGFKIIYYFDNFNISIPVYYTLLDDGIKMMINPKEICEGEEYYLYRVTLSPFFVSTPVVADDSYLLFPSGTGTIIEANNNSNISTYLSYEVYGHDALMDEFVYEPTTIYPGIKMPVFGAKNGDDGVLAIISDGAETAYIEADIGNGNMGYSAVYTTFSLRGRQPAEKMQLGLQYTEHFAYTDMSVSFFPLKGEEANYVGMANRYRKFLEENKGLVDKIETASSNVTLIGGTELDTSFLGMPTTEVFATTTINQAQSIVSDFKSSVKGNLVTDLLGFNKAGLNIDKPGGDFKIADSIGSDKDLVNLANICKELGVDLYYDFNITDFDKDGSGLTKNSGGAAKGTSQAYTDRHTSMLGNFKYKEAYKLVGRYELMGLAEKSFSMLNKNTVGGVSFRTLTSKAYSDFANNDTSVKANMGRDVQAILNKAKENGLKILADDANDYAAALADAIIEVPTTSGMHFIYDYDVPFYQIVFKGYVPMYGNSINMTTDAKLAVLRCIESGTSLKYTFINNYDVKLLASEFQMFNSVLYTDWKDRAVKVINDNYDYYNAIADAHIIKHDCITSEVRKVVYDNGVTVFINYSDEEYVSPLGVVDAGSYIFGKEVEK